MESTKTNKVTIRRGKDYAGRRMVVIDGEIVGRCSLTKNTMGGGTYWCVYRKVVDAETAEEKFEFVSPRLTGCDFDYLAEVRGWFADNFDLDAYRAEKAAAEKPADDRAPWVPASAKTWVEFYTIDEDGNHERDGMANYWDEDHAAAIARVIECRGHKAPHVPSRGSKTEITEEWEDGNRATRVEFSRKEPQMGVWKYFAAIIRDV